LSSSIQDVQFVSQQERSVCWRGYDAGGRLCTFTITSLGEEITRVLLRRGEEENARRYAAADAASGTLPYLSWMVEKGDEAWPLSALPAREQVETLLAHFVGDERGLAFVAPLRPQDHIYGLGERTGAQDKRGQAFPVWNVDPPMHHDEQTPTMYISIPFYLQLDAASRRTSGVLIDHAGRVEVDLGYSQPAQLSLAVEGDTLAVYFFAGPTPADVLRQYSELSGRTPLPPRWALGHHQSRWSYESAAEVRRIARTLRERQHPCDALWLDIDYMEGFRNFTWNATTFAEPRALIEELRAQGLRLVTIIDPGTRLEEGYAVYDQGHARDYFCRYPDGRYFLGEVWPGTCVFPDFSRQDVRTWWGSLYAEHVKLGVAGIWNDMNEPALTSILSENSAEHVHGKTMDSDVLHHPDRSSPTGQDQAPLEHKFFHNAYGLQMARATYEGLRQLRPHERPFVLSRSGTGGIQRYAAVWTGDNTSEWEHVLLGLTMCLNLSMSGVPFVGIDIGGFWNDSNGELLVRFAQLGALLPFCRNHNAKFIAAQEPWAFGEPFESAYRAAIELRYRCLPYLYTLFAESARSGAPVIRPLYYHYPQDAQALASEDEFLFGPSLLSAPVYQQGASRRAVYLPTGSWFDYWSGQVYAGGQTHLVELPLERWPLFVRANSILPLGPLMQYTDERPTDPLTIHCYLEEQGQASYILYEDDGISPAYARGVYAETHITCRADGPQVDITIGERFTDYRPAREWYDIVVHHAGRILNQRLRAGTGLIKATLA
jgi:alpha-glucosidase